MHNKLITIVGPTAVGKSALALRLATAFGGEIVNADSRQVYRYMDIGTAKPSQEQRAAVPHHLIDMIDPDEGYSLALFLRRAAQAIQDIQARSRLPILVGGTGQYVWGLLEGWQVPEVQPDVELRQRLEARAAAEGPAALYEDLARLDPSAAGRIDPRNARRIIRALEVCYSSSERAGVAPRKIPPPYRVKMLGLTLERSALYGRIDARVDAMLQAGWIEEVRSLMKRGYSPELPSLSSLGYRELIQHLKGELPLDVAVERIKHSTHRFARHQYAWFRLSDERIRWYDAASGFERIEAEVEEWLRA
jgi:tRNA dimethylallyltransferase